MDWNFFNYNKSDDIDNKNKKESFPICLSQFLVRGGRYRWKQENEDLVFQARHQCHCIKFVGIRVFVRVLTAFLEWFLVAGAGHSFTKGGLGAGLCLCPNFSLCQYFLISKILSLKSFGNSSGNSYTKVFILDIKSYLLVANQINKVHLHYIYII